MKNTLAALLIISSPYIAFADRADVRQEIQQERIDAGVASGQLTGREARRLENQQEHIENIEKRAEADGVVTRKEKAHLEIAQDRASNAIDRKKHNLRNK